MRDFEKHEYGGTIIEHKIGNHYVLTYEPKDGIPRPVWFGFAKTQKILFGATIINCESNAK